MIGPFFLSICICNTTINGQIALKKQDTLTIGYQSAFLGVNLILADSVAPKP